jgi:murein DD-endopeptidase / murein LD-carboxypeptidase
VKNISIIAYFCFAFFQGQINTIVGQMSPEDLEYEVTMKMCEKGIDLDNCAHTPLYVSFYDWLGTPYKYAGTTKKGIDCSGFTKTIIKEAYGYMLSGGSRDIFPKCEPVSKPLLSEGDLVFFKIGKSSISHVGIYLQNGYFVHATVHGGVMISHLDEDYYAKYWYMGGRLK